MRPALGRLVGERGELRRVGERRSSTPPTRAGTRRLAVAERDRAGLVEQQRLTSPAASTARPLIARTLRWTSRSMPAIPIAESSAPIVVGMRHTSSATRTMIATVRAGDSIANGCERDDGEAGRRS